MQRFQRFVFQFFPLLLMLCSSKGCNRGRVTEKGKHIRKIRKELKAITDRYNNLEGKEE